MHHTDLYPDIAQFKKLAKKGNIIPVYREILADRDTPVSIFEKISFDEPYAFLLESIEGGERWGRYSFISSRPSRIIRIEGGQVVTISQGRVVEKLRSNDPLRILKKMLSRYKPVDLKDLPRFWGGMVGFLGYDIVRSIEQIPDRHVNDGRIPDGIFMVNDHMIIFDHVSHRAKIVACVEIHGKQSPEKAYRKAEATIHALINKITRPVPARKPRRGKTPGTVVSNVTEREFCESVRKAKQYIRNGDIIQTVLSQRFSCTLTVDPFEIYRSLRVINPSPYLFYLKFDDLHLVGSSPEVLVRKEGRIATLRPIAGTRKRGRTAAEDAALEKELLSDPKELAEHVMLVDLARNDLGRVSRFDTITLPEVKIVERYSHVMHIVSSVVGTLKAGVHAIDLLKATFPAGTVSGAPKIRAMEIIDELESCRRGPYAGAAGYFSFNGNMDMAITIRTLVVNQGKVWIQAGAGIVADSNPRSEYRETQNKAAALVAAVRMAEKGLQ